MTLGHRRDKPACSPIGLHGVCGRGWREQRSIVVRDVRVLGPDYVACDPRDQSEVVVPMFTRRGGTETCIGVLDVDSFDVGAFTDHDARELARLLIEIGLTTARSLETPITL
jgi:putative methionine-R-sulfoxide reductase with GAF domain